MTNEKLSVGDKYLSIRIQFGGVTFKLPAFKVKEKKNPAEPDYKGQNVAVWISTKKAKDEDNIEE